VVPGPKFRISHEFISAVAWAILPAGRIVIVVAPAAGSSAAMRMIDRAERLTIVIVARRWRILRQASENHEKEQPLQQHAEVRSGRPGR
jgi:hypothetical protein